MERDGFHSTVGSIRTRAGWGGLTIGRIVVIQAGGAKPGFRLVLGGDDEAVPEEDFGGDGHVEEGEVRLVDAGRVKQFLEGADGGAIEVEDFVEWGHAVGDLSEPRASACRRLLQLAGRSVWSMVHEWREWRAVKASASQSNVGVRGGGASEMEKLVGIDWPFQTLLKMLCETLSGPISVRSCT